MNRSAESDSFSTVIDAIKRLAFTTAALLLLAGCAVDKRPQEVFDEKRMAEIMVDIHIAEGAEATELLTVDSVRISDRALYEHVFQKHGITEAQYRNSFEWYSAHLKEFDEVYAKVIQKLNQMEAARQQIRNR